MKKIVVLFVGLLLTVSFAQVCDLEAQWDLTEGFEQRMIASMNMTEDDLKYEGSEGSFDWRLVQVSDSEDGVTLVGSQQAYLYTLKNYEIEAGVTPMPMKLVMDGGQGGIQYTFWNDGTVDIAVMSGAEGNWTATAEVMRTSLPFSDKDVPVGSGFVGSYERIDNSSLSMNISTPDSNLSYQLVYKRVE